MSNSTPPLTKKRSSLVIFLSKIFGKQQPKEKRKRHARPLETK